MKARRTHSIVHVLVSLTIFRKLTLTTIDNSWLYPRLLSILDCPRDPIQANPNRPLNPGDSNGATIMGDRLAIQVVRGVSAATIFLIPASRA